jgi:uncharacterized damage-inducible protein DinB
MKDHFEMFAAYNRWANGVVYKAASELSEEELNRSQGAFFGSLIGTLNHLLCADRIWMKRFTGSGDAPGALNTILHTGLAELEAARKAEDERIVAWVESLPEERLEQTFSYQTITNPAAVTQRLAPAMSHFFNHQTHHRGQCHATLTGLGKPSLTLDLVAFQRLAGQKWM